MYKLHNGSILIVIIIIKHGSKFSVICFRARSNNNVKTYNSKSYGKVHPGINGNIRSKKGGTHNDRIKVGFIKSELKI